MHLFSFCLRGINTYRGPERDLLSIGSFPKFLKLSGQCWMGATSLEFSSFPPNGGRDADLNPYLLPSRAMLARNQNGSKKARDWNQFPEVRCGLCKWLLNCLAKCLPLHALLKVPPCVLLMMKRKPDRHINNTVAVPDQYLWILICNNKYVQS